jgi:DNA-damage-inducible protein D
MKKEQIHHLFEQFENACYDYKGIECWSARELQTILGYSKWNNFLNVIGKAKKACENAGGALSDHFADVGKIGRTWKWFTKRNRRYSSYKVCLLFNSTKWRCCKIRDCICANLFCSSNPETGNY